MRLGTLRDAIKAVVFLMIATVAIALPFWKFLVYPVGILVSCHGNCQGVVLYVDGARSTVVAGKSAVLHFRYGWHSVEARRDGYKPASVKFHAVDSEQGSYKSIDLSCKNSRDGNALTLSLCQHQIDGVNPASGR